MSRRKFIKKSALVIGGAMLTEIASSKTVQTFEKEDKTEIKKPVVISTWNHGLAANKAAWKVLNDGKNALDAVEMGVRVTESDATNRSVGLGGLPDREGKVTLDACIMNHENECGAVAFLQDIENPISVARKVMEDTPHVMIVGRGAFDFAIEKGFKKTELLTPETKAAWQKWKESQDQKNPKLIQKIMTRLAC